MGLNLTLFTGDGLDHKVPKKTKGHRITPLLQMTLARVFLMVFEARLTIKRDQSK